MGPLMTAAVNYVRGMRSDSNGNNSGGGSEKEGAAAAAKAGSEESRLLEEKLCPGCFLGSARICSVDVIVAGGRFYYVVPHSSSVPQNGLEKVGQKQQQEQRQREKLLEMSQATALNRR